MNEKEGLVIGGWSAGDTGRSAAPCALRRGRRPRSSTNLGRHLQPGLDRDSGSRILRQTAHEAQEAVDRRLSTAPVRPEPVEEPAQGANGASRHLAPHPSFPRKNVTPYPDTGRESTTDANTPLYQTTSTPDNARKVLYRATADVHRLHRPPRLLGLDEHRVQLFDAPVLGESADSDVSPAQIAVVVPVQGAGGPLVVDLPAFS